MNIRRSLLSFFLLMGLGPAALLTGLAFYQARMALKLEISRNLKIEASALMHQIDRMMFERLLYVHSWSHLELMREANSGDGSKRLSQLLTDLNKHYEGVYQGLFCTNRLGKIVASSNPSQIGKRAEPSETWLKVAFDKGEIRLSQLSAGPAPGKANMVMEAALADAPQTEQTGQLNAVFDWTQISQLLDQPGNDSGGNPRRTFAVLYDDQGRVIAASSPLRERGLVLSRAPASWPTVAGHDAVIDDQNDWLGLGRVLAGSALSEGYQKFRGFGWSVQVFQPTSLAFAPIDRIALDFLLMFAINSAAAVFISLIIAGKIAQPILQLTELTRDFIRKGKLTKPVKIDKGELGELTQTFQQMTRDLRKSRTKLVRAAKMAVVGEMAATMAHEVRTPLGIMRSSAQMLQREPALSENGKEMLEFMISENDRLGKLISSLLDCAKPRPPLFAPNHLHAIIRRVLDLLSVQANNKNIRLATQLDAADDLIHCDEDQILQVLLNLVVNAIQILPPGGKITIRSLGTKSGLILNVDDNGPGIPETERRKVFDPFYTQREGGIGLGLTVVQQIIRAHGGDITAGASPPGGARFHIYFPFNEQSVKVI